MAEPEIDHVERKVVVVLGEMRVKLDAAKIEAGRVQIETRPFDLGQLVSNCVKVIAPQARYKGLTVSTNIDPSVARWFAGALMISRANPR